jgi:hypothetical protein
MHHLANNSWRTLAITIWLALVCTSAIAAPGIPPEAQKLIYQVHSAAKNRDFATLEKLMVNEFVWSFGGDENAKQAIAAWKEDPVLFQHLQRVTGQTCQFAYGGTIIECPRNAGINYRAGFKQTTAGWRMVYFVAGD